MLIKIGMWITSLPILGNKGDTYTLSLDFLNKDYRVDIINKDNAITLFLDFLDKNYRIDRG